MTIARRLPAGAMRDLSCEGIHQGAHWSGESTANVCGPTECVRHRTQGVAHHVTHLKVERLIVLQPARIIPTVAPDARTSARGLMRALLQGYPSAVLGRPDANEFALLDPGIRKAANAVDLGRAQIQKGLVPFTLTRLAVVSTFSSGRAFCLAWDRGQRRVLGGALPGATRSAAPTRPLIMTLLVAAYLAQVGFSQPRNRGRNCKAGRPTPL